jgi:hypothetical protein
MTLAGDYTLTISDPSGSETRGISISVASSSLSTALDTTAGLYIATFCNTYPVSCPDGSTRKATLLDKVGDNLKADGQSWYTMTLHPRDKYGNRVNTGSVDIAYISNLKSMNIPIGIDTPYVDIAFP